MKFQDEVKRMQGVVSPLFTPYDHEGNVDLEMLLNIAEFQIQEGINGFFLTGSTGEGLLLSERERLSIYEHIAGEFADRVTIIAHVGHSSTDVACRLAIGAADAGCHWISSVAPVNYRPTFEGALLHYKKISSATDLPFMVYSIGGIIHPRRDAEWFNLTNVCGIKFTGSDLNSVQQLARFVDRPIALMNGFDEQLVASLTMGFNGGIGTTYNFAPRLYRELYDSFHSGDIHHAMELQRQINIVTELMCRFENWSYRKAIMRYIGFDIGPARAPFEPITEEQYSEFSNHLDAIGVLKKADEASRNERARVRNGN
jgi:N-acetylneuraminate lyase